jgi:hypothetical protein
VVVVVVVVVVNTSNLELEFFLLYSIEIGRSKSEAEDFPCGDGVGVLMSDYAQDFALFSTGWIIFSQILFFNFSSSSTYLLR